MDTGMSPQHLARMLVPKLRVLDAIAAKLRKNPEAVRKKIERLGLEVVDLKGLRTTTSLKISFYFLSVLVSIFGSFHSSLRML